MTNTDTMTSAQVEEMTSVRSWHLLCQFSQQCAGADHFQFLYLQLEWTMVKQFHTRMWANAQRDSRPAEYRWRPLFNAAKFGSCPILDCRAVMLPRHKTRWNLLGCPKLPDRSQPLVGRSSPYYQDMWRRYCCLTSFFRLSIHALVAKI